MKLRNNKGEMNWILIGMILAIVVLFLLIVNFKSLLGRFTGEFKLCEPDADYDNDGISDVLDKCYCEDATKCDIAKERKVCEEARYNALCKKT